MAEASPLPHSQGQQRHRLAQSYRRPARLNFFSHFQISFPCSAIGFEEPTRPQGRTASEFTVSRAAIFGEYVDWRSRIRQRLASPSIYAIRISSDRSLRASRRDWDAAHNPCVSPWNEKPWRDRSRRRCCSSGRGEPTRLSLEFFKKRAQLQHQLALPSDMSVACPITLAIDLPEDDLERASPLRPSLRAGLCLRRQVWPQDVNCSQPAGA